MPRLFKDMVVDEPDSVARVNLINRDGSVALHEVSVELASPVVQQGDSWGAKEANLLLQIDDDGVPVLLAATERTQTATLGERWSGNGPWTQTVEVEGMLESDNPMVDILLSGSEQADTARLRDWGLVSRITTVEGGITATCYESVPSVPLPIQIKVVR